MTDVAIRRALISVSDKTGLTSSSARCLARHGVEMLSTGGSAKALVDAGFTVIEVASPHRLSRDHGRARQDAASEDPRRHPGAPRRSRAHGGDGDARASRRSICVVVNLYPFEATVARGADFPTTHREHRYRRSGPDPRGGEEPRFRRRGHRSGGLRRPDAPNLTRRTAPPALDLRKRLAAAAYARTGAYDAAIAQWFAGTLGETYPRRMVFAGELMQTLRYGENPHQQCRLLPRRPGAARHRDRAADPGQGAQLQQPQRHRRRLRVRRRVRGARRRHHQARQSLRRRHRRRPARGLSARPMPATRSARSAASSRSTGRSTPPPPPRSPKIFVEVIIAPSADDAARDVLAGEEEPAPAADRRRARSRGQGADGQVARPAAISSRAATTAASATAP